MPAQEAHHPGHRRIRERWREGQPAFGLWGSIPSVLTAELATGAGYDYVCVDRQHGGADEPAMVAMFSAIEAGGAAPLARVASGEPWMIGRVLDLGAAGVIVPLVDTPEQAERAVRACRYPPQGERSYGPLRISLAVGSSDPALLAADALCIVMIETRAGLDNVEEIAATPGLDALYVGPSDLSLALGQPAHGQQVPQEAIDRIAAACRRSGIVAGMHCAGGEQARAYADAGFGLVTVGVDAMMFRDRVAAELSAARPSA